MKIGTSQYRPETRIKQNEQWGKPTQHEPKCEPPRVKDGWDCGDVRRRRNDDCHEPRHDWRPGQHDDGQSCYEPPPLHRKPDCDDDRKPWGRLDELKERLSNWLRNHQVDVQRKVG